MRLDASQEFQSDDGKGLTLYGLHIVQGKIYFAVSTGWAAAGQGLETSYSLQTAASISSPLLATCAATPD